jgi:hypothetical protein
MAKYLLLFLILAVGALFYPFRDLYVREDPFSREYTLVGEGYWTKEACQEAAKAQEAEDYHCRQRTLFSGMMGTSANFKLTDEGYAD